MIDKVTVIGAGSWGTALACLLAKKGLDVKLWSHRFEEAKMIHSTREQKEKLPGIRIPDNVNITDNLQEAVQFSKFILIVVPSQTVRQNAREIYKWVGGGTDVVLCSKGLEEDSGLLLTDVLAQELPICKIGVLSGPSHAEEVAREIPTTVVSASSDIELARRVQDVLMTPYFRVYTNNDVKGVEIGAALKNIIALCAGISDGLGYGDNTKAALMTRGIAEMARLGNALGARRRTFAGLSGIGDLIVTCTSMHSRNRRAGIGLGQGKKLEAVLAEIRMVVEGVSATKAAYELAQKLNISMPITEEAYQILFHDKDPSEAVKDLMNRDKKDEIAEYL